MASFLQSFLLIQDMINLFQLQNIRDSKRLQGEKLTRSTLLYEVNTTKGTGS